MNCLLKYCTFTLHSHAIIKIDTQFHVNGYIFIKFIFMTVTTVNFHPGQGNQQITTNMKWFQYDGTPPHN